MAGIVDPHIGEEASLFDLAVDDVVRGGHIDIACGGEPRGGDEGCDGLRAEPYKFD